ncbi:MBL fold metallo-hydrolase [Mesorhizobium sp. J428]|uniref:MBL fold metallo-hydrolase n=1 Tax=Mesorhizobium sp. J428 TaxID=2898440 RepID=UPI0035B1590C
MPQFPFHSPPAAGQVISVAPGVLWARIPLPYRLDHVNVYLVQDGESWTLIDTGINTDEAKAAWQALLGGTAIACLHFARRRHPSSSGPHRACRMALRQVWRRNADEPDCLHDQQGHLPSPARDGASPLFRFLC